ncbi:MAG: hypothetical protein VYA51_12920 [Planctomycetota bacterium]|nr:hypothetical protein [Planctomycetota bacterium]
MTKVKREPTTPETARLTASAKKALDREAKRNGVKPADMQRALVVEGLRVRDHNVRDARADATLGVEE